MPLKYVKLSAAEQSALEQQMLIDLFGEDEEPGEPAVEASVTPQNAAPRGVPALSHAGAPISAVLATPDTKDAEEKRYAMYKSSATQASALLKRLATLNPSTDGSPVKKARDVEPATVVRNNQQAQNGCFLCKMPGHWAKQCMLAKAGMASCVAQFPAIRRSARNSAQFGVARRPP